MNITLIPNENCKTVMTVIPHGEIDENNYQELVHKAQHVLEDYAWNILLDLSDTNKIGLSGLVALHNITRILSGEQPIETENGWGAIHKMREDMQHGCQLRLRLCGAHPDVEETLKSSGFYDFLQVFPDRESALQSYELA